MKLFVLFFITLYGSWIQISDGQNCTNPKILKSCYMNYFKSLNISTTTNAFPAYNDYLNYFNAFNTQSRLSQFCGFVYDLTKCLENVDQSCVSPEGFIKINVTGEDAYDYPTNYGIIQYTCGEGLEAWKKIINCTTQNSAAINSANTKCEQSFVKTNQSCSNLVTFLKCTYVLLKHDCGQDAYEFACKADTNGIKYSTPNCKMIDCNDSNNSNGAVTVSNSFYLLIITIMFEILSIL